jgi:hypothetical protein
MASSGLNHSRKQHEDAPETPVLAMRQRAVEKERPDDRGQGAVQQMSVPEAQERFAGMTLKLVASCQLRDSIGAMPSARSAALRAEPTALSQAKPAAAIARERAVGYGDNDALENRSRSPEALETQQGSRTNRRAAASSPKVRSSRLGAQITGHAQALAAGPSAGFLNLTRNTGLKSPERFVPTVKGPDDVVI